MPLWDLETQVLDQKLALNLRSGYALSRAVVPAMLKGKRGAIVNIAAKAALDHPAGAIPRGQQAHLAGAGCERLSSGRPDCLSLLRGK